MNSVVMTFQNILEVGIMMSVHVTVADKKKFTFALHATEFVNHFVGIPFPFLFVQNVAGWHYILSGNLLMSAVCNLKVTDGAIY